MAFLDHIKLEDTPDAEAVRNYVTGQHLKSRELLFSAFANDIVFNGLVYKVKGRDQVVPMIAEFVTKRLASIRVEAIARAGDSDIFMILFHCLLKDADKEMLIADIAHVKNGKIYRVDNCFDTTIVPKNILEEGNEQSNM